MNVLWPISTVIIISVALLIIAHISYNALCRNINNDLVNKPHKLSTSSEILLWNGRRKRALSTNETCNPITASFFQTTDKEGKTKHACRCNWPTLFGQKDLFSDCTIQYACDGRGSLVHKITRTPLLAADTPIDIHDYECSECDDCNDPGPDPHNGLPSCLPRPFNDRKGGMCIYDPIAEEDVYSDHDTGKTDEHNTVKGYLALNCRFVDKQFLASFTDAVRLTARVPNPCDHDLFTGDRLNGECELRMTNDTKTAYCAPLRDNIMTAVKEDTYLTNNAGKFPNTCFRFTSNEHHVNGYVIEYFIRERRGVQLPSPVVSMRITKSKVYKHVLDGLGLTRESDEKMLLFTQPEPPLDVREFPHPFNKQRLSMFTKEVNNWIDTLPAKCVNNITVPFMYNCSAPVQPLSIPFCSKVGASDRHPLNRSSMPYGSFIGDQTEAYAKSTVACRDPEYDSRFPIVPNYNIRPDSTNTDITSTILFFDKSTNTIYPHWSDAFKDVSKEIHTIKRYVREKLRSLPNEGLS